MLAGDVLASRFGLGDWADGGCQSDGISDIDYWWGDGT